MPTLYNNIIKSISNALELSLNEMAKNISHRTIDRKVWLSVASICSRNKSTDCEFVKPMSKLSKLELIDRYVIGLIILKKPCPNSISDIEKIKSFKLLGTKAIELGATINEIQELYNINSGNKPISSSTSNTSDKKEPIKKSVTKKLENKTLVKLHEYIDDIKESLTINDVVLFGQSINNIIDLYDNIKYGEGRRLWDMFIGYDSTLAPKIKRTRAEDIRITDKDGYYSYENKTKVLKPGEDMLSALDVPYSWTQGNGYWRHECISRMKLNIYSLKNDNDDLTIKIELTTNKNCKSLLLEYLTQHFTEAFNKLDAILNARNNFDGSKYGMDKPITNYVNWVSTYMPIILKNNNITGKTWYDGISIRNADCEFWTGRLKTCTPTGIIFWVGGDSTDDEGKISYNEWKANSKYRYYSEHADVYANIPYSEKEEFSLKIFEYIKQQVMDGKLK